MAVRSYLPGGSGYGAARNLVVLTGLAGVGKTRLLRSLASLGEQVIDLERLANHSGSPFGGLGRPPQPSHLDFQRMVDRLWGDMDADRLVWIEDEGPFIGGVGVPRGILDCMLHARAVYLSATVSERITALVDEYGSHSAVALEAAVSRSSRRIGMTTAALAIREIRNGDLRTAVETLLPYYDAAYLRRMADRDDGVAVSYDGSVDDPVTLIKSWLRTLQSPMRRVMKS